MAELKTFDELLAELRAALQCYCSTKDGVLRPPAQALLTAVEEIDYTAAKLVYAQHQAVFKAPVLPILDTLFYGEYYWVRLG